MGSILISNIGNNDIHVKESFILPSHRILEKGPIDYKLAREIGREIFEHVKDLMKINNILWLMKYYKIN